MPNKEDLDAAVWGRSAQLHDRLTEVERERDALRAKLDDLAAARPEPVATVDAADYRAGSRTHHFRGPHHGVRIRQWGDGPALVTVECDPRYAGIGAPISPREARGLAQALLRAADVADGIEWSGREEDLPDIICRECGKVAG